MNYIGFCRILKKKEGEVELLKIQKIYIWYSIIMWFLWNSIFNLLGISGNAFDVQNEQLFFLIKNVSKIINGISLIPVIPGLWVFALKYSIRNKEHKYVAFNVLSILFSIGLWFQYFVTHVVLILGGV